MDNRLIADIKQAEGFSLKAYKDSLGFWTIGYGHLLDPTIDWEGHEITQAVAENLLNQDLDSARISCQTLIEWPYLDTPCRQNAVIELVFNLGLTKWKAFAHTRLSIQRRDWQLVHNGLLNSLWAKQVGTKRSERLANYLLTGQYA